LIYCYKKCISLLLINLTPLIPLSFKGEGERTLERGAKPPSLIYAPPFPYKIKDARWEFKRDYVPLLKFLPPSPSKGEGGYRGMGLEQ
jgi:hypothetical protein